MDKLLKILPTLSIILFAVILRLLPHPPNFAPITAMALFGGVYLNKKYALIVPIIAMLLSDIIIGFHDTMFFVYLSFLLSGVIGLVIGKRKSIITITGGAILASILFYLITNFGVWLVSGMYPRTFAGLTRAYILALPFYKNTLTGDLFYTGLFSVSYELIRSVSIRMRPNFNNPNKS